MYHSMKALNRVFGRLPSCTMDPVGDLLRTGASLRRRGTFRRGGAAPEGGANKYIDCTGILSPSVLGPMLGSLDSS